MENTEKNTYSDEEFDGIIRRAIKIRENNKAISHQDLIDIAHEIGIESHVLDAAIRDEKNAAEKKQFRRRNIQKRKTGFNCHLYSYIIVNGALVLTDLSVPGPWWCHWSIVGWGIGLAFHYRAFTLLRKKQLQSELT